MSKRFICILLALVLIFPLTPAAADLSYGGYNYEILKDGTVCITGYYCTSSSLTIPSKLNGRTVSAINELAILNPSGNLTTVTIPSTIKIIEGNPFEACAGLRYIKVDPGNTVFVTVDNVLFNKTNHTLVSYPRSRPESHYTVPADTLVIGSCAMSRCSYLRSVALPEGLVSIKADAFRDMLISSINLPSTLFLLGDTAFSDCILLNSITLPDTLYSIGQNPFEGCTNLKSINVSPDHPSLRVVNGVLFSKSLTRLICYPLGLTAFSYSVPSGTQNIGASAFAKSPRLQSVTLPSTVTTIEKFAFFDCDRLLMISVPTSVRTIGDYAFAWSASLTQVSLPRSVSIGEYAFCDCALTSVYIPENAIIRKGAFSSCANLRSVTIPSSVTQIGEVAFSWCNPWLVIYVDRYSIAQNWCILNNIRYAYK